MKRFGDELLACAAFTEDKNGAVRIRDSLDHLEHLLHFGRGPDDLAELVFSF